jgi:hypothetical protein
VAPFIGPSSVCDTLEPFFFDFVYVDDIEIKNSEYNLNNMHVGYSLSLLRETSVFRARDDESSSRMEVIVRSVTFTVSKSS